MPTEPLSVHIRPFEVHDRDAVLDLAPRLTIGIAPWLAADAFLAAARGWITGSIEGIGQDRAVFVAEDVQGTCIGFVSIARTVHFTGPAQAYIGELAVAADAEGNGVGRALLLRAEAWAWQQGMQSVALDTGAANLRARGFYEHFRYAEESVKLVKLLQDDSQ